MAPSFEDLIQSHQFTFFVGQEGKPIVVHAAAVAATSQQLDALINGGMEESETRCAKIEDVQVDDFIRFCEYAYRGDYTAPPWEELRPEPGPVSGSNQKHGDIDGRGLFPSTSMGKKSRKAAKAREARLVAAVPVYNQSAIPEQPVEVEHADYPDEVQVYDESELAPPPEPPSKARSIPRTLLRTQFNSRTYLSDGSPKALLLQGFDPKPNSAVNRNFTPVFLAHARLYCFARLHLVESLKALTLDKLHKTLMKFKLYTDRVADIVELARYAYSNPDLPDRTDDETLDDLRRLVVEYVVCEIDTIGKCKKFVKYMEEGGEFVGDFWLLARDYMV